MAKQAIFNKKNVLVIGGAGFIGSHLCDELVRTSKVICVDNYASGSVDNISHLLQNEDFIFLRQDICEPLDLSTFPELEIFQVEFQGIQEIYYLASPTLKIGFENQLLDTARTNSVGVIKALELAKQYSASLLFASSHSIYGDPLDGQQSFTEDYWGFVDHLSDRAAYNEGKRFAETLVHSYHQQFKLDTKIARIFNTYGPRMKLNSGRMIPDFVRAAIDKQDLVIYGDGSSRDTYCYVSDMVQGLMALMRSTVNTPVNLGNPDAHPIMDIANKVIKYVDTTSNVVFENDILGLKDPAFPDITYARQMLGWFPVTDIETGLKNTIDDMLGSRVLTYSPQMSS